MNELVREVEEEIKREKLTNLLKAIAPYAAGIVFSVIAGTAGYKGWQAWELSQAKQDATTYEAASTLAGNGELETAAMAFNRLTDEASSGYAGLAALQAAGTLHQSGDHDAALAKYAKIAGDSTYDRYVQSIAVLRAAYLSLAANKPLPDSINLEAFAKKNQPLWASLTEVEALYALKENDIQHAFTLYKKLEIGVETPQGIRNRAIEMAQALGAQLPEQAEGESPDAPAPAAQE